MKETATANMKICFVIEQVHFHGPGPNGAMVQTMSLARGFLDAGWEVYLVAGTRDKEKLGKVQDYLGIRVVYWARNKYFPFLKLGEIRRILRDIDARVYYTRGRSYLTAAVAGAAGRGALSLWSSTGHEGCRKGHHVAKLFRKKRSLLYKILNSPAACLNDRITESGIAGIDLALCQTRSQQKDLEQYYKKAGVVFKSGHYPPGDDVVKEDPPVVLFLSHLIPIKRPMLFVELASQLTGCPCRFVMAGNLHPSLEKEFTAKIAALDNIEYLGAVPFQESRELLSRASLLVNTSTIAGEGLSNSMVLAWLHGTPVVTLESDPDGIVESNDLGRHSGTFGQMVKDVRFLVENPGERERLARAARKYALEHFALDKVVAALTVLIKDRLPGE